ARDLTADLAVQAIGRVSGVVTDSDGKPVSRAMVTMLTREYRLGAVRYVPEYGVSTNERGEYGTGRLPVAALVSELTPAMECAMTRDLEAMLPVNRGGSGSFAVPAGYPMDTGRGYFLMAAVAGPVVSRLSDAPSDSDVRKPVPQTTWYIGAKHPEGASPLMLSPFERRERVDLRIADGPGYCIQGRMGAGAAGLTRAELADA